MYISELEEVAKVARRINKRLRLVGDQTQAIEAAMECIAAPIDVLAWKEPLKEAGFIRRGGQVFLAPSNMPKSDQG